MVTLSKETQQRGRKTPAQKSAEDDFVGQELATTNGGGNGHAVATTEELPDWMRGYESTGAGLSQKKQDNLVPMATLLQVKSKRANSNEATYIPGAEEGMVHIPALAENQLQRCRKGKWGNNTFNENGLLVQACYQCNGVAEWGQRVGGAGGGFKAYHTPLIDDDVVKTMASLGATLQKDPEDPTGEKKIWKKGDRVFVETRQYALLLHVEEEDEHGNWRPTGEILPVSVNFWSTGHTFAKGWMLQMNRRILPTNGQRADMWTSLWRLHTAYVAKPKGSYFTWLSDLVGWVRNEDHIKQGESLYQAFVSGEKAMALDDAIDAIPDPNDASQYQDREVM